MKILFMGTTPFSCVVLKQLIDDGHEIAGVVTQPDRPVGRKRILTPSPIKVMAQEYGFHVIQPHRIKESEDEIIALDVDCIVTCAYGQIVPVSILYAPRLRSVNVHASLLPKYRGGAPIHWSIIRGERETGVTLMFMDKGMDSGDMLAQRSVEIADADTFGDVEAKLMDASKILIHEDLNAYFEGKLQAKKQDASQVTYAYTIQRDDEYVSFQRQGLSVYNHLRGLIPWPVGYGILDSTAIKIHSVSYRESQHSYAAGEVIDFTDEGLYVAVEGGIVKCKSIQISGKPIQSNRDILNGVGRHWKGRRFE